MLNFEVKTKIRTLLLLSSIFSVGIISTQILSPVCAEEAPPPSQEEVEAAPIAEALAQPSTDLVGASAITDSTTPKSNAKSPVPMIESLPNDPYYKWMNTDQIRQLTEKANALVGFLRHERSRFIVGNFLKTLPEDPAFKVLTDKDKKGFNDCMSGVCAATYSTLAKYKPVTTDSSNKLTAKQKIAGIKEWIDSRKLAAKLEDFIRAINENESFKTLPQNEQIAFKACMNSKSCTGITSTLIKFVPDYQQPGQTEILTPEEKLRGITQWLEARAIYARDLEELTRYIDSLSVDESFKLMIDADQKGFLSCMKSVTSCPAPYNDLFQLKPSTVYLPAGQISVSPSEKMVKIKEWIEARVKFATEFKELTQYIKGLKDDETYKKLTENDKKGFSICMSSIMPTCPAPYEKLSPFRPHVPYVAGQVELKPAEKIAGIATWVSAQAQYATEKDELNLFVQNIKTNEFFKVLSQYDKDKLTGCITAAATPNPCASKTLSPLMPTQVQQSNQLSPAARLERLNAWLESRVREKDLLEFIYLLPQTGGFKKLSKENQSVLNQCLTDKCPTPLPDNAQDLPDYTPNNTGMTPVDKIEAIKTWITAQNAAHTAPSTAIGHAAPAHTMAAGKPVPSVTAVKPTPSVAPGKPVPNAAAGKPTPSVAPGKPVPNAAAGKPTPIVAPGKPVPNAAAGKPTTNAAPGKGGATVKAASAQSPAGSTPNATLQPTIAQGSGFDLMGAINTAKQVAAKAS